MADRFCRYRQQFRIQILPRTRLVFSTSDQTSRDSIPVFPWAPAVDFVLFCAVCVAHPTSGPFWAWHVDDYGAESERLYADPQTFLSTRYRFANFLIATIVRREIAHGPVKRGEKPRNRLDSEKYVSDRDNRRWYDDRLIVGFDPFFFYRNSSHYEYLCFKIIARSGRQTGCIINSRVMFYQVFRHVRYYKVFIFVGYLAATSYWRIVDGRRIVW